jgi:adenine phosphoribosyltransferase
MHLQERLRSVIRDIPDFPKPGILFKDITPVLKDMELSKEVVNGFYESFSQQKIDGVIGIESRGFLYGMLLAQKFNVPFIPVRKHGKLPYKTISYKYDLEYGSSIVELHVDAFKEGSNILIHDDLLATGGTAAAAAELIKMLKGNVAGFTFLVGLDFLKGKEVLKKHSDKIVTLIDY